MIDSFRPFPRLLWLPLGNIHTIVHYSDDQESEQNMIHSLCSDFIEGVDNKVSMLDNSHPNLN